MSTTLDMALLRWSVVCRSWQDLSAGSQPELGAFLAGWFWRDMDNDLPPKEQIGILRDSFRVGYREADTVIEIMERDRKDEERE